jgi:hypothetical protein
MSRPTGQFFVGDRAISDRVPYVFRREFGELHVWSGVRFAPHKFVDHLEQRETVSFRSDNAELPAVYLWGVVDREWIYTTKRERAV